MNFGKLRFPVLPLVTFEGEGIKQVIAITLTRSRDCGGAFYTGVFVVSTIMISPSIMIALVDA